MLLYRFNLIYLLILISLIPSEGFGRNKRILNDFYIYFNSASVRPGSYYKIRGTCERKNKNKYEIDAGEYRSKNTKAKQSWADFEITCKGCQFSNGSLYINKDLRTYTPDSCIEIIFKHPALPEKTIKKFKIKIEFNGETNFHFGGSLGFDGSKGSRGVRLFAREGVSGESGGSGADGENGDDIAIYMKAQFKAASKDTFIKILVKSILKDTSIVFIHNISKYPLTISASGGSGGDGAEGGRGSSGKDARDETEKRSGRPAGDGGNGGNGGNGGKGGKGGTISLFIDKTSSIFMSKIKLSNYGGLGGKGGPGGRGGSGGSGSATYPPGKDGANGMQGENGLEGANGPPPVIFVVEALPVNF